VIASKIVEWDAVDQNGKPVPITPEGVESLHWKIVARLRDIICMCSEAGDPIEDSSEKPASDDALMATLRGN
jgi:hypothetical protein